MTASGVPESKKTFAKGQVIFREGQSTPVAYMVKKGAVVLYRTVHNRRVVIGHFKPGQIFGEMSLILDEPANATAEAEVHSELIVFDRIFLQSLLLKSPNPIQRILRHLIEQLRTMHSLVQERPYEDIFCSICQLLELYAQAQGQAPPDEPRSQLKNAVSHAEFCRAAKTVLLAPQHEIDEVLYKLQEHELIKVRDIKAATYKKDILGQVSKSTEFLRDQLIVIADPLSFMPEARSLHRELGSQELAGAIHGQEYIDIRDLARRAGVDERVLFRCIAQREMPEGLLCFPSDQADRWLQSLDEEFFSVDGQNRRYKQGLIADDIVDEDNKALQLAFSHLGHNRLIKLYAAAGDAAKQKIRDNVSKKLLQDLDEESRALTVSLEDVVHIEEELFRLLDKIKSGT